MKPRSRPSCLAAQGKPVDVGGYYHPERCEGVKGDASQRDLECDRGRDCIARSDERCVISQAVIS